MELRHRVMLAYINGRQQGLPARYQKVAYLESTGVQWLNSGILPSANVDIKCKMMWLNISSVNYFGSYNPRNYFGFYDSGNKFLAYYNSIGLSGTSGLVSINTIYEYHYKHENGVFTFDIDGVNVHTSNIADTTATNTYYLFARNDNGTANNKCYCRLYSCSINNHQFVPCIDTENNNKPGMYDLVSRQFLVNQGTGADFIVGPDIHDLPAEFQEVEYLQGDGSAYIGNIWQPTLNMKVETSFQCQTITSMEGIFGYFDEMGTNIRYGIRVLSTGAIQVANWTTSWTSVGITYDTNKHKYIIDSVNDMFYYDDQSFSIPKTKTEQLGSQNNTLFAYYGNYKSKGKMFYQKVWEGTTLTHHYIPCYNKTTLVAGMYDLITKQFKTNSGTGSFIVGPDIN